MLNEAIKMSCFSTCVCAFHGTAVKVSACKMTLKNKVALVKSIVFYLKIKKPQIPQAFWFFGIVGHVLCGPIPNVISRISGDQASISFPSL